MRKPIDYTQASGLPSEVVALLHDVYSAAEIRNEGGESAAYHGGTLSGAMAFALAAHQALCLSSVVMHCKDELLNRAGLTGYQRNNEAERLKGWIVGLFGGLEEAAVMLQAAQQAQLKPRPNYRLHRLPTQRHK